MKTSTRTCLAAWVIASIAAITSVAQAPGIKRTLLQRTDVGNNMEMIVGLAEIAPGGSTGRHTHFGVESGYMISGAASMEIEGETPRLLNAGDSYTIPAHKIHDAKAVGDAPAKVIATYVVEKGKPLATPAR